jgi:hypothetical protein
MWLPGIWGVKVFSCQIRDPRMKGGLYQTDGVLPISKLGYPSGTNPIFPGRIGSLQLKKVVQLGSP